MKMKVYQVICIFFCTCFLYSCIATGGRDFPGNVKDIKIGVTTRQEIENKFGFPFKADITNGLKSYMYHYFKFYLFLDPNSKELFLSFNEDDTVKNYGFYSTFKEDKKIIFN
ncbi:MAG: hypothetical protein DCC88_09405 [Spirobacillus cienkowskii]|uniref:Outer membrane protein assembly factor BamE n=1 Tax=Spirobacillus cienkowskii TaxID=495820 RepID=A0A369KQG9_9BACT|nr:MAG: hypothetical protein DCC88_09405 [Spirobacillus cienkowskii]